ncbi:energy transducer TonB [Stutzerimonas sp. 381-2]|nr:energy transducer TonB [Pseudomonas sp.]|tara:strand:- start:4236 stop:5063 length:828 start_codon:yes stop_codon:yes gene_type:complete
MSSLSMPLPSSFPVARPQWRSHASAAAVTVALHAAVFGLLLHGWTPELTPPGSTQVLKTQLVSLPTPQPKLEVPVEPEPAPEPVEAAIEPVFEEPQVDPRIEQHRLEQAELAFKRAEQKKQEKAALELQRLREEQREQKRQRERQERLEAERREQLAREAQQREQAAQQAQAAAERARQAEAAAAASRQYLPIAKDAPDYPSRALDKGIEGTCTVSYSVNPQGRIENPKAQEDCHPLFIRPSLTAAKSFRYQPRIVAGRAVTVPEVKNTFHYRIQ